MTTTYFPSDLSVVMSKGLPTKITTKELDIDMTTCLHDVSKMVRNARTEVKPLLDWAQLSSRPMRNSIPAIKKVVFDIKNNTTIVYFNDDTKEIARVMDGDTFDKEVGVLQCLAKKMYGSRSRFLKDVVDKGVVIEKKEKKKSNNTYLDRFLKGEKIAVNCKTEEEANELFNILRNYEIKWSDGEDLIPYGTYWHNSNTSYANGLICGDGCKYTGVMVSPAGFYRGEGYKVVSYQDLIKSV